MHQYATKFFYSLVNSVVAWRDRKDRTSKWFPTCQGNNFLYAPLFADADGEAYFTKYHAEKPDNPLTVNFKRYKTDILRGRLVPAGTSHSLRIDVPRRPLLPNTTVPTLFRCSDLEDCQKQSKQVCEGFNYPNGKILFLELAPKPRPFPIYSVICFD